MLRLEVRRMAKVKFNRHNVRNTENGAKARVWYSLDNRTDGRKCVTLYAKDYGHDLNRVFGGSMGGEYKNDTDVMTDYFDKGRFVFFEGDALYAVARAAVEAMKAKAAA
jgi:hypothetical protein